MRSAFLSVMLAVLALTRMAAAEDWISVSSIDEIKALPAETEAVKLLFKRGPDDARLLATLAECQPELHQLSLVANGGATARPIEPLARFKQLEHLEIHEGVSNFCYANPTTGAREMDIVGGLTTLHTLVLDVY